MGDGYNGISVVYSYMINIWMMDFEVLEVCFFVCVDEFFIC